MTTSKARFINLSLLAIILFMSAIFGIITFAQKLNIKAELDWEGDVQANIEKISNAFVYLLDNETLPLKGAAAIFFSFPSVDASKLASVSDYYGYFSHSHSDLVFGLSGNSEKNQLILKYASVDTPWFYSGMAFDEHYQALAATEKLFEQQDQIIVSPTFINDNNEVIAYIATFAPSDQEGGIILSVLPVEKMLNGLKSMYFPEGFKVTVTTLYHNYDNTPFSIENQASGHRIYQYEQRLFHSGIDWQLTWEIYDNFNNGPDRSLAYLTLITGIAIIILSAAITFGLLQQNRRIKEQVKERTLALEQANEQLIRAQEELVQSEKLASLGSLVAGVAHELNTPIGTALTASSVVDNELEELSELYTNGTLSKQQLERFIETSLQSSLLVTKNIKRSATLITNFKQMAVDQASERRREFNFAKIINEVMLALKHQTKKTRIAINYDVDENLVLDGYPGPWTQILTNLILNSLTHGFEADQAGNIEISASLAPESDIVTVTYKDDGKGIAKKHLNKIFDPFFTTKLGQGGSGLGLNIVFNIVTQMMAGEIKVDHELDHGVLFTIKVPRVSPDKYIDD